MKYITYIFLATAVALTIQSCNLLSAAGITSQGQPTKKVEGELTSTTANSEVNVDHSQWTQLLKKHVDTKGLVDYKGFQKNENCTFHPIDKLIQLHEEKIALYERMLKEKDEMMAKLEKLIGKV